MYTSKNFRPAFDRICDLRAFVPPHTPFLAATATITKRMRDYIVQNLGIAGCCMVSDSPNKPNICYEAVSKTTRGSSALYLTDSLFVLPLLFFFVAPVYMWVM